LPELSRASDARDGLVTVCTAAHVGIAAKPRVLVGVGRAGLPDVRFHDLRHPCATLLFTRGVHPKIASEKLRHFSVSVTLDV
jgi:integrase